MRIQLIAVLALGLGSAPVAAATVQPEDIMSDGLNSFESGAFHLALNIVQQFNIPITVNQALAIAINSQNVVANAETNVISINETISYFFDLENVSGLAQPLDLSFLNELLVALGIPGLDLDPSAGPITAPLPGNGLPPGTDYETPAPVPLPAALPLSLMGMASMGLIGWRRRVKSGNSHLAPSRS